MRAAREALHFTPMKTLLPPTPGAAALAASLALAGCACHVTPPPLAAWGPVTPPLAQRDARRAASAEELGRAPVLDIHTHTFNSLYLPLVNIARGRVSELPVAGTLLSETAAVVLAQGIIGATLANGVNKDAALRAQRAPEIGDGIAARLGVTPEEVERGQPAPASLARTRQAGAPLTPAETLRREEVARILRDDDNWRNFGRLVLGIHDDGQAGTAEKVLAFLRVLTSRDAEIRETLPRDFGGEVAWFVHHAMDMGPTYAQDPDGRTFWDYHGKQLPRIRALDAAGGGGYLHFVAFNPFRGERSRPAGGWEEAESIQLVKRAIEQGAWGVKYYPPAGYRASHNEIPPRPRHGWAARQQWRERYEGYDAAELDELNFAFFLFCAKNRIPVFAHCADGEFQAANCYGKNMAHPAYYRQVLERLAAMPGVPPLRLCLGHAGGAGFWFGTGGDDAAWGQEVYELCTRHPEVYCEVGVLAEILTGERRAAFIARLGGLIERSRAEGRHDFGGKLLYGSDWFMPDAAQARLGFLSAYRQAFAGDERLRPYTQAFLAGNALAFLGEGSPLAPASEARTRLAAWRRELGW